MLKVWSSPDSYTRLQKCETAMLVVNGIVHQFKTASGQIEVSEVAEIRSNQEETDTRVIVYMKYASSIGFQTIVVRSPDTDILVLLLHHSSLAGNSEIQFDTGSGKHRRLVNTSELADSLGEEFCECIIGFHVYTGEDCTSAFKGKGKKNPFKLLQKYPKFQRAFIELGRYWEVSNETIGLLEEFTCIMYERNREKNINNARFQLLLKMVGPKDKLNLNSKVDFARLPPCRNSLLPHIYRVNYRLACFKKAGIPIFDLPSPCEDNNGWKKDDNGLIEPIWTIGPILPVKLVDILEKTIEQEETAEVDELHDVFEDLSDHDDDEADD